VEKSALKHPKFFNRYVDKVAHGDLNVLLAQSFQDLQNDLAILKQADFDYAYQPDKWTIGKLIRHFWIQGIVYCKARPQPDYEF
jgi:hypothetical protein